MKDCTTRHLNETHKNQHTYSDSSITPINKSKGQYPTQGIKPSPGQKKRDSSLCYDLVKENEVHSNLLMEHAAIEMRVKRRIHRKGF